MNSGQELGQKSNKDYRRYLRQSMLAIPYAMAKLGSISQAADHYLNAVEAFYEETDRIGRTINHIETGALLDEFLEQNPLDASGWYWRPDGLPEGPESRYLFHLLAGHSFQEGLKNYRDLNYLRRNLEEWQENIGVYRNMLSTRELAYQERLPKIERRLRSTDLDGLVDRKLQFDARLNKIEQGGDTLALATDREFELWDQITALERNPALATDLPEAHEVRDKIKLLKGVLQWDLDKEFKSRLWKIRRDVHQTGQELVKTQRARRNIDTTMRSEPLTFRDFNNRVDGLKPRIEALILQVDAARGRQRVFLQSIAVEELRAQQQRLNTYSVQARFALAAIYDLSGTVGDASQ